MRSTTLAVNSTRSATRTVYSTRSVNWTVYSARSATWTVHSTWSVTWGDVLYAVCYLDGALYAVYYMDGALYVVYYIESAFYAVCTWTVHSTRAPMTGNRLLSTRDRMVTGWCILRGLLPGRCTLRGLYLDGALYAGPNDGQQAPLNPGQDGDRLPPRASLLSLNRRTALNLNTNRMFLEPSNFLLSSLLSLFVSFSKQRLLFKNSLFSILI